MEPIVWLIALAVFIIIEIITLGLATIWFACGALAAFLVSIVAPKNAAVQLTIFTVVSLASLLTVRPYVARKFNRNREKTNCDSLINQDAKVIETIDNRNQTGAVYINGLDWTARTVDDEVIQVDEVVRVVEVKGVKLIVKRLEEES